MREAGLGRQRLARQPAVRGAAVAREAGGPRRSPRRPSVNAASGATARIRRTGARRHGACCLHRISHAASVLCILTRSAEPLLQLVFQCSITALLGLCLTLAGKRPTALRSLLKDAGKVVRWRLPVRPSVQMAEVEDLQEQAGELQHAAAAAEKAAAAAEQARAQQAAQADEQRSAADAAARQQHTVADQLRAQVLQASGAPMPTAASPRAMPLEYSFAIFA